MLLFCLSCFTVVAVLFLQNKKRIHQGQNNDDDHSIKYQLGI